MQYQHSVDDFAVSITRAALLVSDNMTSFDPRTGLTNPRVTNGYEAVLFTADGGYFVVDERRYPITRGTVRFLKPGQTVYSKKYRDAYVIYFNLPDDAGRELVDKIPAAFECNDYLRSRDVFKTIIRCYVNRTCTTDLLMYSKVKELLFCFFSAVNQEAQQLKHADNNRWVATGKRFIEENFMKGISLSDIAAGVNLHPNYFHRLFRTHTGVTPLEYLTSVRLQNAADMLLTSTKPVGEVALKCGFDSSSYFIAVFAKKYGCTPNRYRLRYSGDVPL